MAPDFVFVIAGIAVLLIPCVLTVAAYRAGRKPQWTVVLLWALLSAGMLVQAFAPHFQIAHNAFVMPKELVSGGSRVDPAALIARARQMQILSSVLLVGSALGLAVVYRRFFFGPPTASV